MRTAFLKRIVLCLGVFIAFVLPLPASVGAQVIPLASSVYEDMDLLYLLAGKGTPSGSRPWTKAEAQAILGSVRKESLQAVAHSLYTSIQKKVEAPLRWNFSDGFSLSAYADVSVENYIHSNSEFSSYGAWDYSYVDRKPLVRLRLDMAVSDFFYTYSDLQYGYGLHTKDDTLDYLDANDSVGALIPANSGLYYVDENTKLVQYEKWYANNIITSTTHIDFQTPKRSVISLGSERWNATFSRDRISWGNSKIGNFILDDHVDFHEYFALQPTRNISSMKRWSSFRYTMFHVHTENVAGHRLSSVLEQSQFGASEMSCIKMIPGLAVSQPRLFSQSERAQKFNAIAHIELAYVPFAGFRLYGQFALDQAVAPNEGDNPELPAWGMSLGADYAAAFAQGVLQSSIEASMTLPHMYRRDIVDFLMARRYAGLNTNAWNAVKLDYIGSPYGGDALVLHARTLYKVTDEGSLSLAVTGVLKGGVDMFTVLDDSSSEYGTTMFSDDVIHTSFIATLAGALDVGFSTAWQVYAQVSVLAKGSYLQIQQAFNPHAWDVQFVMGTTFSF